MPLSTQTLIFDIETIGIDFEKLDEFSQKYIAQWTENEEELEEAKDRLSFSPLTGEIVAIGVLNPETDKGAVYLRTDNQQLTTTTLKEGVVIEVGDEKEILKKFWETVKHYDNFVSFNGRAFDVPYLMIRSAILGVKPSKNLMSNRYLESQKYGAAHVDLLDQLTFYGAVRKKHTLHFWAKAFAIPSPKEGGITGDDMDELFKTKKYLEIAKYNLGDLKATKELYKKWLTYLR
jgi:DNA polymerase elongation subunit (family B)